MPMNMTTNEVSAIARQRGRGNVAALGEIEPMEIDTNVGFDKIGCV
jgi:hypothetical protein